MSYEKGLPEFLSNDSLPYASTDISKSIFRSIDVVRNNDSPDVFASKERNHSKFGGSLLSELFSPYAKSKQDFTFQVASSSFICPERPYHLARTHFILDSSKLNELMLVNQFMIKLYCPLLFV